LGRILKTAGNLLGYKNSSEAIEKMSESKKGCNVGENQ
jgi:hypothetical protein